MFLLGRSEERVFIIVGLGAGNLKARANNSIIGLLKVARNSVRTFSEPQVFSLDNII